MRRVLFPLARWYKHHRKDYREHCRHCLRVSPLGFYVPNIIWQAVVGEETVWCLDCFARVADRKGIQWDVGLLISPVSYITSRLADDAVKEE